MKGATPWMLALTVAALVPPGMAKAQWNGGVVPLSVANAAQARHVVVSDGQRGAIAVWEDFRIGGGFGVYAGRIDARGYTPWDLAGVAVCDNPAGSLAPAAVTDHEGGAIISCVDSRRGGPLDIYSQRINGEGELLWSRDGVFTIPGDQPISIPSCADDGAGGAYVAAVTSKGFQGQHLDPIGVPLWGEAGLTLIPRDQMMSVVGAIAGDGAGRLFVGWVGTDLRIHLQLFGPAGERLWSAGDWTEPAPTVYPTMVKLVPDGTGGVTVFWMTWPSTQFQVLARRVGSDGHSPWPDAVTVIADLGVYYASGSYSACSDGSEGVFVVFTTFGNDFIDLYAQRVNGEGVIPPEWPMNGLLIAEALQDPDEPQITADGMHGAVLSWRVCKNRDLECSHQGLFVQRVDAEGHVSWGPGGKELTHPEDASSSGSGIVPSDDNAIVIWSDDRNSYLNTFATCLSLLDGIVCEVSVEDVRIEPALDGTRLTWTVSMSALSEIAGFDVEYSEAVAGPYARCTAEPLQPSAAMSFQDSRVRGTRDGYYRLVIHLVSGVSQLWGPLHFAAGGVAAGGILT